MCAPDCYITQVTSTAQCTILAITFVNAAPRKHGSIELPGVPIQAH